MHEPASNPQHHHLETLGEIRNLMEQSTRFLSLSGLSGVWAGFCALVGAFLANQRLNGRTGGGYTDFQNLRVAVENRSELDETTAFFIKIAIAVFVAALVGGIFFTTRKARNQGKNVWNAASRRLLLSLFVPLATGGIFCLALLFHQLPGLVAPATLVFYGLALVGSAKFTVRDVWSLGVCEILLGLFGCFKPGFSLELWAVGFGFLHIIYGGWMWWKYERS